MARQLKKVRPQADDRVGSKTDIIGSMIALKKKRGAITQIPSIAFFVKNKIAEKDLAPRERIPTRLTIDGVAFGTDVQEWPRMAPQADIIFDGRLQGTLSCFARSSLGVFGVSCAHCLAGADGNPTTPTDVEIYSATERRFLPAGASLIGVASPGAGKATNFGYADCGLFTLEDSLLANRANAATPLAFVKDEISLFGKVLTAFSALRPPGVTTPERRARVSGVHANALGELSDIVLDIDPPGTFHGDSGMLWVTSNGMAAAIHGRGEVVPGGSRVGSAMAAYRAARLLAVDLFL